MNCKVGDWVRFYNNGELVIGVVEYKRIDQILNEAELSTTAGSVYEEQVLERRGEVTR